MKIVVLFADLKQLIKLSEQNNGLTIYAVSEIPEDWMDTRCPYKFVSLQKARQMYAEHIVQKFVLFPILIKDLFRFYKIELLPMVQNKDILYVSFKQLLNHELKLNELCLFSNRLDLDYLSIHIMAQCNLKCAQCSSMSGLVHDEIEISYEKTKKSIKLLSKVYDSVNHIQLLGGEPLLSPVLLEYCHFIRTVFPYAYIEIVTNGTLLLDQGPEFFGFLNENEIAVYVSYYPVLSHTIDTINSLLNEYRVSHTISERVFFFEKYYDFSGCSDENETFQCCQASKYCKNGLTLFEDFLYPCVAPIALERAQIIANPNCYGIPVTELITADAIRTLIRPMTICKYCHIDRYRKWKQLDVSEVDRIENFSV